MHRKGKKLVHSEVFVLQEQCKEEKMLVCVKYVAYMVLPAVCCNFGQIRTKNE